MTWTCFGVEMIKRIQICKQLYRTIQPFLSADVNGEQKWGIKDVQAGIHLPYESDDASCVFEIFTANSIFPLIYPPPCG